MEHWCHTQPQQQPQERVLVSYSPGRNHSFAYSAAEILMQNKSSSLSQNIRARREKWCVMLSVVCKGNVPVL